MTCIVALVHNNRVYMGGDSAASDSVGITERVEPKVWKQGQFIIGFCNSFRMGDILKYQFRAPAHPDRISTDRYMRTAFVDEVMICFKENNFLWSENGSWGGGNFIVGYRGRIFNIGDDFHVGESREGFDSIGSGYQIALGSLYTSTGKPQTRIRLALTAAEKFAMGVRGPFKILSVGD